MLHNQAYLNLIKNGVKLPEQVIIDQFCPPATYFRYLSNVNVNDVVKTSILKPRLKANIQLSQQLQSLPEQDF